MDDLAGRRGDIFRVSAPLNSRRAPYVRCANPGNIRLLVENAGRVEEPDFSLRRRQAMDEQELRKLIAAVKHGTLPRRRFMQMVAAYGLTAPLATQLLALSGVAHAQPASAYKPTKRGGGGALKLLWWQGATLLNPHFAVGTKDQEGSRIFYEPLAAYADDGSYIPILATGTPSGQNGSLAQHGKSVIWKLKKGVQWHDGKPFSADDVIFNWEYAADPATSATTIGDYKDIKVEKIDSHTVKVIFDKP